jgi:hypothetical protein
METYMLFDIQYILVEFGAMWSWCVCVCVRLACLHCVGRSRLELSACCGGWRGKCACVYICAVFLIYMFVLIIWLNIWPHLNPPTDTVIKEKKQAYNGWFIASFNIHSSCETSDFFMDLWHNALIITSDVPLSLLDTKKWTHVSTVSTTTDS